MTPAGSQPSAPGSPSSPDSTSSPDSPSSPGDRRGLDRIPTRIEVDYQSENTFLFAYITDISAMGIFVRTDDPLEVGKSLTLRFSAPPEVRERHSDLPGANATLELSGIVTWNTRQHDHGGNPGMGVRFDHLDPRQRSRLLELVRAIAYLDDRPPKTT